jgi:NitT/TauT family transport system substrate-binding protein
MNLKNKKLWWILAVATVTALAIAALYFDFSHGLPGIETSDVQDKPIIRIGHLPITHSTPLAMAHEKNGGEFADFTLELVKFSSWPELTEALFAGQVDGAVMLFELALAGHQRGIPIKAVALSHRDGNVMVARPEIADVSGLSGKRVAIPNRFSAHHVLLHKALQDAGLTLDDVEIVEMAPPDMMSALAGNEIAAYLVAEPFGAVAEVKGIGKVLLESQDIWVDSTCCVLVFREEMLRDNPKAAGELTAALIEAGRVAEENTEKAIAVSNQYFGHAEDILKPGLARTTFSDLAPSIEEFEKHQQYLIDLGVLLEPVDLGQLINEEIARQR